MKIKKKKGDFRNWIKIRYNRFYSKKFEAIDMIEIF